MEKVKSFLSFILLIVILISCSGSKNVTTFFGAVYPILTNNAKKCKVPERKYFVITKSGEEIIGTKWKQNFNSRKGKPVEVLIGDRVVELDSITSFQNYEGHARRFVNTPPYLKVSYEECFAFYIRKGSKINLLHYSKPFLNVASGRDFSSDMRYVSVFYIEFSKNPVEKKDTIAIVEPLQKNEKVLVEVNLEMLSGLSQKNAKTKAIFENNNQNLHQKFAKMMEFVDAYNE